MRLIFRFFEPDSGHIVVGGQKIDTLKLESLRRAIGIVPQDTSLFNSTIYENIAYGRVTATAQEVEQAAERAHLTPLISSLPQGFNSPVGERGLKLSGRLIRFCFISCFSYFDYFITS